MAGIFRTHYDAAITASLTGIGDVLGAEFLAVVGGSLAGFASADHLAGYAGLAPAPHDSGYRTGKPAPAAALQPAIAARLLHLSDDQHPTQPSLTKNNRPDTFSPHDKPD